MVQILIFGPRILILTQSSTCRPYDILFHSLILYFVMNVKIHIQTHTPHWKF